MNFNVAYLPPPRPRAQVIALHCSGAGASQWRHLAETLGPNYEVLVPEHYGCESSGPWSGDHAFTIADEAARAIALIDESEEKVHLVGHSYGGGVALHVALVRPDRIASMALYEPSAFHLLRHMGEAGAEAYAEIAGVARRTCESVLTGDYRGGVAAFVDYWNGPGAWNAMRPAAQKALISWAPKGPLDFRALLDDPTPRSAYRALQFPVLLLHGENAPMPTRTIAEVLSELLPNNRLTIIDGAGHMGPLTHASEVSRLIVQHIVAANWRAGRSFIASAGTAPTTRQYFGGDKYHDGQLHGMQHIGQMPRLPCQPPVDDEQASRTHPAKFGLRANQIDARTFTARLDRLGCEDPAA